MNTDLQLISDGDGIAVIGEPSAVESFLTSNGLQVESRELPLSAIFSRVAAGADGVSSIAAGSGRWVQITQQSANLMNVTGNHLMTRTTTGLHMGVVQGSNGQIEGLLQFAQGPGAVLANPAILAGVGGVMAQVALQQAMKEIREYLATIDEKVDDVLRAQKDAVFADMIAADFIIDDAMTVRGDVGRVSDVTWSKVQGAPMAVARTQAYVLRQLDALADKLEREKDMGNLALTSKNAKPVVAEWLAVLARCFQLQDALAILELDRVLDASPDELDRHRVGLKLARERRQELIGKTTSRLMTRMDTAASRANTKVLLHPVASKTVVDSTNQIGIGVVEFNHRIGLDQSREALESRRWVDAATDARDRALETGAQGVGIAAKFGTSTFDRGRLAAGKLSAGVAEQARRRLSQSDLSDSEDHPDPT